MTRLFCLFAVAVSLVISSLAQPAAAVVQFYMEYKKAYLDTHADKEYAAAVNKAADRCFVCHQGKNRKNHNAFGIHLVELLDRKKDIRDKEKIQAAIKKVVEMHVDPKDDNSETYLDRIKASKWPGGELSDLKKEPPQQQQQQAAQ
jgi:cytochrome c2